MPINSRAKGARAERELAKILTEAGFPARRGQQFSGSPDSPDVVCETLKEWHIECKMVERLNLHDAYDQAARDAGPDQEPIVIHRKNGKPWMATISLDKMLELLVLLKLGNEADNPTTND